MRDQIAAVADGRSLTRSEAAAAMRGLMSGEATPAEVAAFLTALRMKGETAEEIAGMAEGMRERVVPVESARPNLVDTCGTGGGTVPTFNVSTAAAFVVAGAGVPVAKHGNRRMTSACGSADVLEALGARLDLEPAALRRCLDDVGIAFLFAQAHHPAMRHVAPVRRELPFRTVFNCLGPLSNPAGARYQVIGVYEERLVPILAEALALLGSRGALVVHGRDGLDELSTLGATRVAETRDGVTREYELRPEDVGLERASAEALAPGRDAAENAALVRGVLTGEPGPRREIVLLNAAAALVAAGAAADLRAGLERAAESIDRGDALARLEALVAATRKADRA